MHGGVVVFKQWHTEVILAPAARWRPVLKKALLRPITYFISGFLGIRNRQRAVRTTKELTHGQMNGGAWSCIRAFHSPASNTCNSSSNTTSTNSNCYRFIVILDKQQNFKGGQGSYSASCQKLVSKLFFFLLNHEMTSWLNYTKYFPRANANLFLSITF